MITITIRAAKQEIADDGNNYRIYVIEGEGYVLYVGKSVDAVTRLESHLNSGAWSRYFGSELDMLLVKPSSNDYTVTLYDESDVCRLIGDVLNIDEQVTILERKLIYDLSPVFNDKGVKKSADNMRKWYALHPAPVAEHGVTDDLF
jgi:predicted GIY-YIG superfamily endonuclease